MVTVRQVVKLPTQITHNTNTTPTQYGFDTGQKRNAIRTSVDANVGLN